MREGYVPIVVTMLAVVMLQTTAAAGQAPTDKDSPRTAWGDPDLNGTWSYASLTPLQRPASMGDREFYTAEEAAARNLSVTLDQPDRPGDVGSYNALWFDRGQVSADLRTSLIVDPPDGRLPVRQDAQEKAATLRDYRRAHPGDSWLDRSNWDRCITYHGVPPVGTSYNNTYHILQTPEYVAIHVENIHDVRIIPIDGRPHLNGTIRQWNGDSRGHWDGNTLVIETLNYSAKTEHRFPSTPNTRAIERFTRVDENNIDYQFTIEDAEIYTQPWTVERPMPRMPNYVIYEYACHEGNYALPNILTGERERERATTEAEK